MNRSLGTKWFTFYTKVRPWFACIATLNVVVDFFNYVEVYTSFWWTMLYFAVSITQAILAIIVFTKSRGDYINFVCFVKKVLIFETISMTYSFGMQQYIKYGFNISIALISGIIMLVASYFIWYRLNIKYFNKRIISAYSEAGTYEEATYTTQNAVIENTKTSFCRKCGNKLLDGAKFCNKCGKEIIDLEKGSD